MSIAPPGHPTDETDPAAGNRQARDTVRHDFMSVQALRGRENSAKAKWQDQGWELVSENRGTLRTELHFRRVKPKTLSSHLLSMVATFRGSQPKTQLALVVSCTLLLVVGVIGIVSRTQSSGGSANPSAAQTPASTAPPVEPVTRVTVDQPLDDTQPSETSEPSERPVDARTRDRARVRARARAKREQRERRRNTAQLQSGVTCAELGETDILVTPGADIDADGDGVGCES